MGTQSGAPADLGGRVCSTGKLSKPLEEFNFRNRSTGIRHRYCRERGKKFTRNHYRKNKRQYVERTLRSRARGGATFYSGRAATSEGRSSFTER